MNSIKRNDPEHVIAVEVRAKMMKSASTFYDRVSSPPINMDIVTLIGGTVVVTEICAKMFMPIGYFETVKPLSGSVIYFHVAMLDIPPISSKISSVECQRRLSHGTIGPLVHFNFSTKTYIGG